MSNEPFSSMRPVVHQGVGAVKIVIGGEEYLLSQINARELAYAILRAAAGAEALEGIWSWLAEHHRLEPPEVIDFHELEEELAAFIEAKLKERGLLKGDSHDGS